MTEPPRDPLEARILTQLRRTKRKHFLVDAMAKTLACDDDELDAALERLAASGEVVRTRKGRVALASRLGLVTGRVQVGRRGRAVVIPDEPDIPIAIARGRLRPAMHGDRVLVEVEPYRQRGLQSGSIREIVERGQRSLIGIVAEAAPGERVLVPSDPRLGEPATLAPDGLDVDADLVVEAAIVEYPSSYRAAVVRVERVLGPAGTLPTEIESVCRSLGIDVEFEPQVVAEVDALVEPDTAELAARTDLRDRLTFTIDPADARDHDDAVAIERTGPGYRVTVSIADVCHYVRPGTALDVEAYERGTSVYFPDRCVPMLPERLSADLASLVPGRDRLAVSVTLDVDATGAVTEAAFARSVICSRHRLSYEQAQKIVDDPGAAGDGHDALAQALQAMAACAGLLQQRRSQRGSLDLDIPEAQITVDAEGRPTSIDARARLFSHRIIEEFMIAANEAVARELGRVRAGFIYRIHEAPDAEAVSTLAMRLSALGMRLGRDGAMPGPRDIQAIIEHCRGQDSERLVNTMVLRSMNQARYSARKNIHFGLASEAYAHFTSPIRRYPDLVVHRALCASIAGEGAHLPTADALDDVAEHCSRRERRATEAERDIGRAATILYMQRHVGERFEGTVTAVERWGFYVALDGMFVEGFVPVARLREYYSYVSARMELHSRDSDDTIRIGQRMSVVVATAELNGRRLELEPDESA